MFTSSISSAGVHLSCADLLLKEGANLDHQVCPSLLPLSEPPEPISHGHMTNQGLLHIFCFHLLPPSLSQSCDGSTALHTASYAGALSLIELMLLNGANPDIKDLEGRLPLHWATYPRSPKCISALLKVS